MNVKLCFLSVRRGTLCCCTYISYLVRCFRGRCGKTTHLGPSSIIVKAHAEWNSRRLQIMDFVWRNQRYMSPNSPTSTQRFAVSILVPVTWYLVHNTKPHTQTILRSTCNLNLPFNYASKCTLCIDPPHARPSFVGGEAGMAKHTPLIYPSISSCV